MLNAKKRERSERPMAYPLLGGEGNSDPPSNASLVEGEVHTIDRRPVERMRKKGYEFGFFFFFINAPNNDNNNNISVYRAGKKNENDAE